MLIDAALFQNRFSRHRGSIDYDAVSSSQTNAVSEKVAIDSGIQESFKTRAIPLQKLLH